MANLFSARTIVRIAGACVLLSLGYFLGAINPFLSAAPFARPASSASAPAFTVNRFRKGDRSPLFNSAVSDRLRAADAPHERRAPDGFETARRTPLGCDPAFSPFATSSRVVVYGRCMVCMRRRIAASGFRRRGTILDGGAPR